ncbi:MAG: glycosyltransferase family 2 protein [Pseudomonadota bacterium]
MRHTADFPVEDGSRRFGLRAVRDGRPPETIAISMATYNGAAYLGQQLDSIAGQSFDDWHLWVRDDASTDGTPEILEAFAAAYPDRVTVLADKDGRLGVAGNFGRAAAANDAPYVAFSDQDDVWRPDRLEQALEAMRTLEARHPPETPVLVHADRRLIDGAGREITGSYWGSRGFDAAGYDLGNALVTTLAAGAAMLVNRPLLTRGMPLPEGFPVHDAWFELIAHGLGVVGVIDGIALDWRRHGANTSGATTDGDSPAARRFCARASRLLRNLDRQRRIYAGQFRRAETFRAVFGDDLNAEVRARLDRFLALPGRTPLARLNAMLTGGPGPQGVARRLAFAALCGARHTPPH